MNSKASEVYQKKQFRPYGQIPFIDLTDYDSVKR